MDKTKLSPQAQELIHLTTRNGHLDDSIDVSIILKERSELMSGLHEYLQWRDHEKECTSSETATKPIEHSIKSVTESLLDRDVTKELPRESAGKKSS